MRIELEFLDMDKVVLHNNEMVYKIDESIAYPNAGDRVYIEGMLYEVKERDFIYLSGAAGIDLKISFWCEEVQRK
ncbi:hypothetical protein FRY98_24400 [Paenibacillus faecis]|uniref:Uncharacterized protein n=1 Tax=Paenibacillus faecis TaxID=862114 RepID=A0A5D0CNW2_9BACL|nr:hypothetical protein [Paenibacillus faecis]TYA10914.1 hypothetical protein FRY98_24400 [Paenibacillus faecis]